MASAAGTLGVLSGLLLLAIFATALTVTLAPLLRERDLGAARALIWLAGIAIGKFALLPSFPGYWDDVQCWNNWSIAMAYGGPTRIYEPQFFCDYPPGYLYMLWIVGNLAGVLRLATFDALRVAAETPAVLVDFLLGLVIFAAIRRFGRARCAFVGMLAFALNPALLYDSVVWGQVDSTLALPLLLSVLLVLEKRFELGWATAAIAVLIKPQGLILLPILGLWTVINAGLRDQLTAAAAFAGTLMIGIAPFQIGRPWNFLFSIYFSAAQAYRMTSDNAFNLMGLLGGLRRPDYSPILGIPAFTLGMALFLLAYLMAGWLVYRQAKPRMLLYSVFLAYLAMFVLAPRMHERYLYPALALIIPLTFDSPLAMSVFAALSGTFLFNLAYVKGFHEQRFILPTHGILAGAAALLNVAALAVAGVNGLAMASRTDAGRLSPPIGPDRSA